ncbi:MAG: PIG-L family deacetylase [Planctomycetes bacterium]|nr:PIG-L family deacetylase [Planctomycetota bacterium]
MEKLAEVGQAAAAYGVEQYVQLDFPPTRLDTVHMVEYIDCIRDVIAEFKPRVVYVVHGGDVHTDHQMVFAATMSVLKPFYMADLGARRVLCYETLSSTEAAFAAQLHR